MLFDQREKAPPIGERCSRSKTEHGGRRITAALQALLALKVPCQVDLFTDSSYLRNAFEDGWLASWKAQKWHTAAKKPVKNADLWKRLSSVVIEHDVTWHWVEGHSGDAKNELVDRLAVQAREELAERLGQQS